MRRIFTSLLLLGLTSLTFAQVTVTINLDVRDADFDAATEAIFYSGGFNGWAMPGEDADAEFLDNGDGTLTLIYEGIEPGFYWSDFYEVDLDGSGNPIPTWGTSGSDREWSGFPVGIDQNVYVGTEDVVYNTKWGGVYTMNLSVDMNAVVDFDASTDKVYYHDHVGMKYNGTEMLDEDADGIYTVTLADVPSTFYPVVFAYSISETETVFEYDADRYDTRVVQISGADFTESYVFDASNTYTEVLGMANAELVNISLYPNPSKGVYEVNIDGAYNINVIDVTGKTVYKGSINNKGVIDLTNKSRGLYFATFTSGVKSVTKKIVLE
ncbi:MAG: T9SS type A sorting domain-containing protein [Bacteroidota bacterium]